MSRKPKLLAWIVVAALSEGHELEHCPIESKEQSYYRNRRSLEDHV